MMTTVTSPDGHVFDCWRVSAQGPRKGSILILQEIFGVTDQLKGIANRYATLGYEVAIPALFDRQERGAVIPFTDAPRGRDLMLASNLEETIQDVGAVVSVLAAEGDSVAVIGFCWGGGLALRAAQKVDIVGAVAFYGTRLPQYMDCPLKAPLLGHFGKDDAHVPPEMLEQVQSYFPEIEVHVYDAGHAFANEYRSEYVESAAQLAHQRTEEFLNNIMTAN